MTKSTKLQEVIIIGGGFTGGILALLLEKIGCIATIVDPKSLDNEVNDMRATAINSATVKALQDVGVYQGIQKFGADINAIKVQESDIMGNVIGSSITYDAHQLIGQAFGMVVNNKYTLNALHKKLRESKVNYIQSKVKSIDSGDHSRPALVELENGDLIKSLLVIGSDGRFSKTRKEVKIQVTERDYHQHALVANLKLDKDNEGIAFEHFTPSGPFALVPLQGKEVGLIHCDKKERIQHLASCDKKTFLRHIAPKVAQVTNGMLQLKDITSSRFSYPLSLIHAKKYFHNRVAIIGDAAHAIHPISGLGLNLGVKDSVEMFKMISEARSLGGNIASNSHLSRYQGERRLDVYKHIAITDGFDFLYRRHVNNPLVAMARRGGFSLIAKNHLIRKFLSKQATYV